jgi:hypothetical protein
MLYGNYLEFDTKLHSAIKLSLFNWVLFDFRQLAIVTSF